MTDISLEGLLERLAEHEGIARKAGIGSWAKPFAERAGRADGVYGPGDDAGAVAIDGGFLLLSGEGLWPPLFDDPQFAGFCAVSINVNDIYAMGGRPVGLVSVVFEGDAGERVREGFLSGLQSGLDHYGLPLLGGHTSPGGGALSVAVCIAGRATRLLRGGGARPGDVIIAALDLHGEPHHPFHAWDTVTSADPARTRSRLEALVHVAEDGLASACRDISNAGLLGTLAMMLEASGAGAQVDIGAIPVPRNVDLEWWLLAYPSFGFLLAASADNTDELVELLGSRGIDAAVIGDVRDGSRIEAAWKEDSGLFLDWRQQPVTGFFGGGRPPARITERDRVG